MNIAPASVRARAFDAWATDYERYRPGYPDALFDLISERLGLPAAPRAVDLGAGTGKVARSGAARGWEVTAVEPGEAMLDVLRDRAAAEGATVRSVRARAEDTGLPSATFDVALAGEAYHWFNARAALAEMGRIVRPLGGIALFWSVVDDSFAPIADERTLTAEHGIAGPDTLARPGPRPETGDSIRAAGSFGEPAFVQLPYVRHMTGAQYLGLVRTKSHLRTAPPDIQERFSGAFEAMLASHGVGPAARVDVPYVVDCWIARRTDA